MIQADACAQVHTAFHLDHVFDHAERARLDFVSDGSTVRFLFPLLTYVSFGVGDALVQCWAYWVMSQLDDDITVLSRWVPLVITVRCWAY
eukprot:9491326-Pyramimonas_sp.AAC.1